jgi:hypothetical protein
MLVTRDSMFFAGVFAFLRGVAAIAGFRDIRPTAKELQFFATRATRNNFPENVS